MSHIIAESPQRRRIHGIFATVLAFSLSILALTTFLPLRAGAAEVDVISSVNIANMTTGDNSTRQYDTLKLTFGVDTTGKTVHSGDSFSVTIPSVLEVFAPVSFAITAPDGTAVAQCSAPTGKGVTLSCVFTSYADTHADITASGFMNSTAVELTDNPTVAFRTINGTISATIPGEKIGQRPGRGDPPGTYKFGYQEASTPDKLTWNIWINENTLNGSSSITLTDVFGTDNGGFTFDPARVALQVWPTREAWTGNADPIIVPPNGSVNGGTFTVTETAQGFTATWPATGTGNGIYALLYITPIKDLSKLTETGTTFTNTADINGTKYEKEISAKSVGGGTGSGSTETATPSPSASPSPSDSPTVSPSPSPTTPAPSPSVTTAPASPSPSATPTPAVTPTTPAPVVTTPAVPTPVATTPAVPTPVATTPAPVPSATTPAPVPSTAVPSTPAATPTPSAEVSTPATPAMSESPSPAPSSPSVQGSEDPKDPSPSQPGGEVPNGKQPKALARTGTDSVAILAGVTLLACAGSVLALKRRQAEVR